MRHALAIDGGNSKTDVALVREDGTVVGVARGGGSSPHRLGAEASIELIDGLIRELQPAERPTVAVLLLAGVDFADEELVLAALAADRGWAERTRVWNDTFAVLRAGTERDWGVAVVCGAGMNCVGIGPDGRHVRFPALGTISGDWGGGYDLGQEALFAAARSEDGRGPRTLLERGVPEHFGLTTPLELAEAIHRGRVEQHRLTELAPLVIQLAADDPVAAEIVDRLVDEVVAFVRTTVLRLDLAASDVDVVLGGGLLQQADPALIARVAAGIHRHAPGAAVRPAGAPGVLGSALLALDELGATDDAKARLRSELDGRAVPVPIGGADG
jgi:N-acetylglucosamine kinase-like BadF-type ATPase